MKRQTAEKLADRFSTMILACEGPHPGLVPGMKAAAILIADVVAEDGTMDEARFLTLCGLEPKRRTTPRQPFPPPFAPGTGPQP